MDDLEDDDAASLSDGGSDNGKEASADVDEDNSDHNTDDEIDPSVEMHDVHLVDTLELEEDDAAFVNMLSQEEINLGCVSLTKVSHPRLIWTALIYIRIHQLVNLGKKIFNSPTLQEDFRVCCEWSKVKPKLMLCAVVTRWNTMAELLGRALELREPLNLLVHLEQHNRLRGVRLLRFKLSKNEWELLSQLHTLLDVFLEATKKISQTGTPLLHDVLPIFDILTGALDDFIGNEAKHPTV